MRMRLTVTKEWDVDPEFFTDVEWPAGSGERKDLATPEEIAAYQEYQLNEGDLTVDDVLDLDDEPHVCKVEAVPYVQTTEATTGENPFLADDGQTAEAAATTTEESASASTSATGTDEVTTPKFSD